MKKCCNYSKIIKIVIFRVYNFVSLSIPNDFHTDIPID